MTHILSFRFTFTLNNYDFQDAPRNMSLLVSTGASVGGDVGPNVSTVSINIYVYRVFFYILNQLNIQIQSYLDKIHLK